MIAPGTQSRHDSGRRRQRGSVFIIVLAILSVLILLAATLSYTARLEVLSARNFADGVQARMAAATGVGWFFATLDGRTSASVQPWTAYDMTARTTGPMGIAPAAIGPRPGPAPTQPRMPVPTSGTVAPSSPGMPWSPTAREPGFGRRGAYTNIATELAQMHLGDESAKININALGSWNELRRPSGWTDPASRSDTLTAPAAAGTVSRASALTSGSALTPPPVGLADSLYAVLSSPEVDYRNASPDMARDLAQAILRYRYGPDGQPGLAGLDDDGDNFLGGGITREGYRAQVPTRMAPASRPAASAPHYAPPAPTGPAGSPPGSAPTGVPPFDPATPTGSPVQPAPVALPPVGILDDGLDNDGDEIVDEPDEGIDEPDEFIDDPREEPNGDDRPFRTVEDLLLVDGMTVELYQALRPYVTVFSASERRIGPEREAPAQMDLNLAESVEIYGRLRAAFPLVSPQALAQFSANLADYRDADSIPRVVALEGTGDPIFGVEVTPFITEVWPDSITEEMDGDDGQYIEIFNPWDVAISVSGWSLHVQGTGRVSLRGVLVPGGFLIVTDDYNEERDPKPEDEFPQYGSFYDIFGLVPNSRNHLMVEIPQLEIPNEAGMVELRDAAGNLVDQFQYGGSAIGGLRRSYQRGDPRIRVSTVERCTPYGLHLPAQSIQEAGAYNGNLLVSATIKNAPIESPVELFQIGCSYISGQSVAATAWQTPAVGDQRTDILDERLVDLFTVWSDRSPVPVWAVAQPAAGATTSTLPPGRPGDAPRRLLTDCGRINVNSAPLPVLRALPGLTYDQAQYLLSQREAAMRRDAVGRPLVYATWSELLADDVFWDGAPQNARLAQAAEWLDSVSFTSNAYLIESENRTEPPEGPRLASRSKVEALVSTDGGQNQVVVWRYVE